MFVDTLLFFVIVRYMWKRPLWQALAGRDRRFGVIDVVFITSNLLKIPHGAWLPLVLGAGAGDDHVDLDARRRDPHREDPPRQRARWPT